MTILLGLHVFCTLAMVGIIWFVQVVHYPLFARIGSEAFTEYERAHQSRTSLVVAPLMLGELATGFLLVINPNEAISQSLLQVSLGLLAMIWICTFLVQVPLHHALARGFDRRTHRRLVMTNWCRTSMWTARGVLVLVMITSMMHDESIGLSAGHFPSILL